MTNLRCAFRIAIGLMLGLIPAAILFVYGALGDYLGSFGLRFLILFGGAFGAALGAMGGTVWAMVFLNAQTKAAEGARVE